MIKYICRIFHTFKDYILYFYFSETHLLTNYIFRDKNNYLSLFNVQNYTEQRT